MTIHQSETYHNRVYIGAHGNLSLETAKATLKAVAVDDVVETLELPIGLKLTGVRVFTEGLGASVTVDIKAGSTTLLSDEDVSGKVAKTTPIKPVYLTEKCNLELVIGGAAATGEILVQLEYVNVGY